MNSLPPFDRPLRVLHLEDSATDRALIHDSLRHGGLPCEVRSAVTREEFALALAESTYDLILSDFTLPSYDGATALALAQKVRPEVPFLFVSGTIGEERAVESLKSGATDYVLKHNLERLVPAVRRALREAAERTARRQAQEALRTAEARLREMAETIRDVFWVTSPDGSQLLYVSAAYAQVWGRPVAEAYARPTSWLESVHADDRPKVLAALQQLAQGAECRLEYRVVRPDGTERFIEDRGYPVLNPAGKVERAVGVATDVTERRLLEDQLRQAQKMEAIGQLAGGVAHDFNNALTVITGYAKLLLDYGGLPSAAQERLRVIYAAGMRAGNLTRQLLLFSRKHAINKKVVALNALIDELAKMLARLIGEDVQLELKLDATPRFVTADFGMLEQVLMNLVVNARDAMPDGGQLTIATELRDITAAAAAEHPARRPGEFVCLSVRDTGTGIPPEVLPRIFEPFFTTKAAGVGTGLGLATVFGIVQEHQGWIEVETAAGTGTCFRVFLPPAPPAEVTGGSVTQAPFDHRGSEMILLVEDEAPVREFAVAVLQQFGYRVLQAGSGVEALETWKWHHDRIALVITDLVMPDGISGFDLVRTLRTKKPAVKVILTSGYASDLAAQVRTLPRELPFLQKPYLPNTLVRMVRDTLDQNTPASPPAAGNLAEPPKPGPPRPVLSHEHPPLVP